MADSSKIKQLEKWLKNNPYHPDYVTVFQQWQKLKDKK